MKTLFITATRLGDAVLSTGLLEYMAQNDPGGKVTVACGALPAPIFAAFPNVETVLPMVKAPLHGHWLHLWVKTAPEKWDRIVDLRNSAVSRLIRSGQCYRYGPHIDRTLHKVEQMACVMGLEDLPAPPAPKLYFTPEQQARAQELVPDSVSASTSASTSTSALASASASGARRGGPVLAIGPAANWIGKVWPAENFITLIRRLTGPGGIFEEARVAVFAAPGEGAQGRLVLESLPPDRRIDLIGAGDPALAAACLARCAFYIGNDSGLMHCAAASGVPTLGLFGPSWPHLYRPWGAHCAYVATKQDFAALTDYDGYDPKTLDHSLMEGLSCDAVCAAAQTLWQQASRL